MENNAFRNNFDILKIKNMESFIGESTLRIKSELVERKDKPLKSFDYSFIELEYENLCIYLMTSEFWNLILARHENVLDIYNKTQIIYSVENLVGKKVKINAWDDTHCYIYLYNDDTLTEVIFIEKNEDKYSFSELRCKEGVDAFDSNRRIAKPDNSSKPIVEDIIFITRSNKAYSYNFNLIYEDFYRHECVNLYNTTGYCNGIYLIVVVFYDNNDTIVALSVSSQLFYVKYLYLGIKEACDDTEVSVYHLENIYDETKNGYLFTKGTKVRHIIIGYTLEYFCHLDTQDVYLFRKICKDFSCKNILYCFLNCAYITPFNLPKCFEVPNENISEICKRTNISEFCKRSNLDITFYKPGTRKILKVNPISRFLL